jgi:hypothetical protein
MYVCVCVCLYVCVYVCVQLKKNIYSHLAGNMCEYDICMHIHLYACVCYTYTYVCMGVRSSAGSAHTVTSYICMYVSYCYSPTL